MPDPIPLYAGDDWIFPCTYSVGGVPADLTGWTPGADLYIGVQATPIALTVANGGAVLLDQTTNRGQFKFKVARIATADFQPDASGATVFPTRLHPYLIDPNDVRNTKGIVPIKVLGGRGDMLGP